MKRIIPLLLCAALGAALLTGCGETAPTAEIAATTLPVYTFTAALCQGTELTVTRLVTESVSCLHDYTLTVRQVKAAQAAGTVVISGAGLESFLDGVIPEDRVVDASTGISLLESDTHHHHSHEAEEEHEEEHEHDPHIWLDPENGKQMAQNICQGLSLRYPKYADTFRENLPELLSRLDALEQYGKTRLETLSSRELITFHDGFAYFAEGMHLTILAAVEEESGSEASARDLKELICLVREHPGCGIFTEQNGSTASAQVISRETGAGTHVLDMAMSGDDYFAAMYQNIDAIWEAMG